MIWLIEGLIGSGKTYFVVNDILQKYFRWDSEKVLYVKRDDIKVEVYTNIDGFFLCSDLNKYVDSVGGLESFFNIDNQEKITNDCKHVYAIDECQKWFDRKYYNKKVFNFFQYSRHLGIDIYLLTQDYTSLSRELQALNEHHIKVARRSYSMFGEFRYNYMVGYEIMKRKTVRPDLKVFKQYRSALSDSSEKPKMFAKKFMVYIVLLVIGVFFAGYFFMKGFGLYAKKRPFPVYDRNASFATERKKQIRVDYVGEDVRYRYFLTSEGSLHKEVK